MRGIAVLHINHELRDADFLNELLLESGCSLEFVGIPYRRRGGDELGTWRDNLVRTVGEMLGGRTAPVAVVEDGGYAVEAALRWGLSEKHLLSVLSRHDTARNWRGGRRLRVGCGFR